MGFFVTRLDVIGKYLAERRRFGVPEVVGSLDREMVVLVDGVGRLQAGALMARRALREVNSDIGTVLFDWQTPLFGEVLSDLVWYRRNRLMGAKLARKLLALRRAHPTALIHVLAFSGGAGIALFGLEHLHDRPLVETLILACPAVSSTYNLAPALSGTRRAYALVSHRDTVILGLGTRLFGTTDRRHEAAAGQLGFRVPQGLPPEDSARYARLREIRWTPALCSVGHRGGHTGWASVRLLRRHLIPLLSGTPDLPTFDITQRRSV